MTKLNPIPSNLSRVLICGLGSIGRRHLRILSRHWPLIDTAVLRSGYGSDCDEIALASQVFSNLDDALSWKPEAAIIATPATDHLSKALQLAKFGIPLLIEKPLGSGLEPKIDWTKLMHISKDIPILIGYVLRHDPCAKFVKDLLDKQTLGDLVEADFYCGSWLPDWRPGLDYRKCVSARRELGGGVLLELSHEIDLAQWLLGSLILQFSLLEKSQLLQIDVEDNATLVGRTVNGCSVTIRLNFCTKPASRYLTIRGSAGEVYWKLIKGEVTLSHEDPCLDQVHTSNVSPDDLYFLQMNHFLACVMRNETPICSLDEGLNALELVMQAQKTSVRL